MDLETCRIDLHMHSTVSDGTDSPEQILSRVRERELALFALTDHDSARGCGVIVDLLQHGDPAFLTGVEFSCRDEQGKYHILGYGFDPQAEPFRKVLTLGHTYRFKKVHARLDFLRTEFGFEFPEEELRAIDRMECPGKPHIGNLMVKYGYAASKEEAIERYINKLRFRSEYVKPEEAIRGILDAGGVPVLAHPSFGDGDQWIVGEELEQRVRRLTEIGLQGLEAFYAVFSPKQQKECLSLAQQYDLYATAGSDYHGRNKLNKLAETGLDEEAERPQCLKRFLADIRQLALNAS